MHRTTLVLLFLALAVSPLPPAAIGQESDPGPERADRSDRERRRARMPVRVIGGRLVLACEISTRVRRIPANLFIDFERPCGLELHNQAANPLRVDAEKLPITIHLSGFDVTVPQRSHGNEDYLNEFTRVYSRELGETACLGAIGSKVLSQYHVTFDLANGFIFLEAPREKDPTPPEETEGAAVTGITLVNDLVWIPVRRPDGEIAAMGIGTMTYDTIVDENVSDALGHPAGDIGPVRLKTIDLSKYVAFRPEEFVQVHADGALGSFGLNLLSHFRVEVDRVNRFARVMETKPPEFPEADLAFFRARVDEQKAPLLAYLDKYPESRLARDAANLLLSILLDEQAPAEEFETALTWIDRTRIEDLRASEAFTTMKGLLEAGRSDVAIRMGEIGVVSGRKDRYPEAVHKIHSKLGELLLETEDRRKAWEHLLSAAFGLPEDGMINLNLGRFYELEGRYRRAMSRYIQAVIVPESGPQAVAALERLQKTMGGEPLSVDLVDRLVSGKVWNFNAATKFEATEDNTTNRTVLVQLFTNAHYGLRLPEGWRSFGVGGAMAIEGLLSHFPADRIVVLAHHIAAPEPTALMNALGGHEAGLYGITEPKVMVINGVRGAPGAGRWRDAEKIYNQNRVEVLGELKRASAFEIEVTATLRDGKVEGVVTVTGPSRGGTLVQIVLAERGVLYPGKAKVVVHRMVARGALTGAVEGVRFHPVVGPAIGSAGGKMKLAFAKTLDEVQSENEAYLANFEKGGGGSASRLSTRIDPRQVEIIAFVRDELSREILQSAQVRPTTVDGE